MLTTKALLCFALMFAVTVPVTAGYSFETCKHHDKFVAFDVALTRHFKGQKNEDKVLYNKINLNIGRVFHNGEFVCPRDGVYEFIWMTLGSPGISADTAIYVNHKRRRFNLSREGSQRTHILSTASLITRLKKDDRVWIATWKGNVFYGDGNEHSSFQGKLLIADK